MQAATEGARGHDWLSLTGGAIGDALPLATGAAVACPDRKVVALEGDGSGMYTLQSLWTMARERLDVTVVIFANRGYQILRAGDGRRGRNPGPQRRPHVRCRGTDARLGRAGQGPWRRWHPRH